MGFTTGVEIAYGPLKTEQATSTADYDSYTSTATCPPGLVVLGCQSITTNCQFDGSAFRQTATTCVTWNSITFWGVPCPESTVQAVAFCGKLEKDIHTVHYDLHEDKSSCDKFPGSQLVGCTCGVVYGSNVACAGAIPEGESCIASTDSPLINPGSVCLEGPMDRQIIKMDVSDGVAVGKCPKGFLMTDCTCAGIGCQEKSITGSTCQINVDTSAGFQGAFVICVDLKNSIIE